ncbi:MAG: hypothetical protein WCQ47_04545 [bacterium]
MKNLLIFLFFLIISNIAYSQDTENSYDKKVNEFIKIQKLTLAVQNLTEILQAEQKIYDFLEENTRTFSPGYIRGCYTLLEFLDSARAHIENLEKLDERTTISILLKDPALDKITKIDDFIDKALTNISNNKCISGRDLLAINYIATLIQSEEYKGIYAESEFVETLKMIKTFMNTFVNNGKMGTYDKSCKLSLDMAMKHFVEVKAMVEGIKK